MMERQILATSRNGSAVLALVVLADDGLAIETTESEATTRWPLPAKAERALLDVLRERAGEPLVIVREWVEAWPGFAAPEDLELLEAIKARAEARRDGLARPRAAAGA